jgi:Uncharacterized proteins involved in stress response, homologs of TerZ and putative cAMP-binding protein CABP1
MSVSLKKGQGVSLSKSQFDLSQVTIGLGWDVAEKRLSFSEFFKNLFSGNNEDYDLDVIAFLCDKNGKITNLGTVENGEQTLDNGDIIFFNNMIHKTGHVWLTGDNRTGEGEGDDEQIILKLNALSNQYYKIVFIVQIYDGAQRKQHFGEVQNAFIRAVDANNIEMVRFDLSTSSEFVNKRSMIFAELNREASGWQLNREASGWQFKAIGNASESDTFVSYIEWYS